jgi:hypothetical protein
MFFCWIFLFRSYVTQICSVLEGHFRTFRKKCAHWRNIHLVFVKISEKDLVAWLGRLPARAKVLNVLCSNPELEFLKCLWGLGTEEEEG